MSPWFAFVALWAAILAVAIFACAKGGISERLGALVIVVTGALVSATHSLLPEASTPLILLTLDGALAAAFLLLAVIYGRAWLGAAMVLQAIQFSLHAYYFIGERPHDGMYSLVNNIVTLSLIFAVVTGTISAMRRRAA